MIASLVEMRPRQRGTVVAVGGGPGRVAQLQAMGLRPGVMVEKLSSQPLRGPVTLRVGRTELAVGFGIARRIEVETGE